MEHDRVVAGRLEILDVEAGCAGALQVLGEGGGQSLPLRLPVRERLLRRHATVVRAEQGPAILACRIHPEK
ncbi:hypothetical protein ACWDZ8_09965 [Streptomyces sp. NPDC003233]